MGLLSSCRGSAWRATGRRQQHEHRIYPAAAGLLGQRPVGTGAPLGSILGPALRTAPIPVSSGRTDRHRLHRGGDRQANSAMWGIAEGQDQDGDHALPQALHRP